MSDMSAELLKRADRDGETGCLNWRLYLTPKGYGRAYQRGKQRLAHVVAFETWVGPIAKGMVVCHRCDNPRCIEPDHLFLGTVAENNADMVAKGRQARGAGNGKSKLTIEAVRAIRRSAETLEVLAARYGVSDNAISNVRTGRTWSHVDADQKGAA